MRPNALRALPDVNLLLALCYRKHEHHAKALVWLGSNNVRGNVIVCRVTHLSLLRLLNTPAVMGTLVCSAGEAWRLTDLLLTDSRFAFWNEPGGVELELRRLTEGAAFSPKLWQDAYLAAFAITAGLSVATFDKGFAKFNGVRLSEMS